MDKVRKLEEEKAACWIAARGLLHPDETGSGYSVTVAVTVLV